MMVLKFALFLALAFILQTTWIHLFEILGLKPDLIVLALVYVALAAGAIKATIFGFCIGFTQDIHAPDDLGLNALIDSIIGFAVGWCRAGIMVDNIQAQVALVVGAVLVHDLIYYVGQSGTALGDVPLFWLRHSLGRSLYTGLIGLLLSYLLLLRRRRSFEF